MKKMMLAIALLLVLVSCGGGGDESCTYDISLATNGATQETATSYWDCLSSHGDEGAFSLFDNNAGLEAISDQIIAVTWEETGCREAHLVDANGGTQITEITGSVSSGALTFTATSDSSGNVLTHSCSLINLS